MRRPVRVGPEPCRLSAAASVRGAAHQRSGMPNQDAFGLFPAPGLGDGLLVALADGHGSAKSFRSETGSRLAVQAAQAVLGALLEPGCERPEPSALRDMAEARFPREIVREWRRLVDEDLAARPIDDGEWERLCSREGASARRTVEENPYHAYGATLLAALLLGNLHLYLQIGDGDIVAVGADGAAWRPVPGDARLLANATTSLARKDAWRDFRRAHALPPSLPALLLLATDGYANSFAEDAGFLQVASDIHAMVARGKWAEVATGLEGWLTDASSQGSGDDVTAAVVAQAGPWPRRSRRPALWLHFRCKCPTNRV